MTETDRQFCDHQQELYQDAVESFYQIAALWTGLCDRQKAALSAPEGSGGKWKRKYLMSNWWPEVSASAIMKHISLLHDEFISTVVSYLNDTYHLTLEMYNVKNKLLPKGLSCTGYEETLNQSMLTPVVLRYEDIVELILSRFEGRTFAEQGPYELTERCHRAAWRHKTIKPTLNRKRIW